MAERVPAITKVLPLSPGMHAQFVTNSSNRVNQPAGEMIIYFLPQIHSQAVHPGSGKRTRRPATGKHKMKTANDITTTGKVPENWAALLELSTREVFEIMLGCTLQEQSAPGPIAADFTAMVGMAGRLCGLLTLRCSTSAAAMIATKMLGADVKESDPQMWDAVGEIANMIAGNFKNKLTGVGERCMLSVPTVITGSDYNFRSMADSGPLEVVLLFEGAPINVGVEIHS